MAWLDLFVIGGLQAQEGLSLGEGEEPEPLPGERPMGWRGFHIPHEKSDFS